MTVAGLDWTKAGKPLASSIVIALPATLLHALLR